ncbi:MAG: hypothetical protein QF890_04985 [Myxococcota bacterium]|nr:hypothetical protein [Deltaproteobacteria bacterium]MCP4240596.1 hypothetical protein [bacterium]MDP6073797.1 hypothetical protein [Myxococcota bacterium]MDP6244482.1 hypothetical protein [Myxococcota bacterium]MDP7073310.1 hypothetical protein [Myxococcota bacterium]
MLNETVGGGFALVLSTWVLVRVFWGHAPPVAPLLSLSRREAAFVRAAAAAIFPAGGAVSPSGGEARIAVHTDRWLVQLEPRVRLLVRLLFFLVEHATLFFPAPGLDGFRRFSSLRLDQCEAALEGWRISRLAPRRLVFQGLRAIVTMGYLSHPPVLRELGLAPRVIGPGGALANEAPIDPRYAETGP